MLLEETNNPLQTQDHTETTKIIIIGGGVAGCGTALQLADLGYRVTLLEKDTLFSGSSSRNPGRLALGFHYIDAPTAIMCLRETIELVKSFPGFRVAEDLPWDHPLRHGRYLITKDSLFSKEEILATYKKIQEEYARLVDEDPKNKVFGSPEDFFKLITDDKKAFEHDIDTSKIAEVIETPEHLLDCEKFLNHLADKVRSHQNIALHEKTTVIDAGHHDIATRFFVKTNETRHTADYVINSSWQNIESINDKAGFTTIPSSRTNRLKVLAVVKLPKALRDRPSMFFCMGPHCMFSNMGNGLGMMTYAPETNLLYSDRVDVDAEMQRYLDGNISQEEKDELAKKIVAGVSTYIPEMQHADIVGIRCGIVQTRGHVDIFDHNSEFHKRAYYAVDSQHLGWFSNPSMKLVYFIKNAKIITALLVMHKALTEAMRHTLENEHFSTFSPDLLKMFVINFEKAIAPTEALSEQKLSTPDYKHLVNEYTTNAKHTMAQKKKICAQLTATSRLFAKCADHAPEESKQHKNRRPRSYSEPLPHAKQNGLNSFSQQPQALLASVAVTAFLLGHVATASVVVTIMIALALNHSSTPKNQCLHKNAHGENFSRPMPYPTKSPTY